MKELMLLLGLGLLIFSPNVMAEDDENICDELYANMVAESGDAIKVQSSERFLRCLDHHGASKKYKAIIAKQDELIRIEDGKVIHSKALEDAVETKEFTKKEIAEILFFAMNEKDVESSMFIAIRQRYKLDGGNVVPDKVKDKDYLTDPKKLCGLLMGNKDERKNITAIQVVQTAYDKEVDSLEAIGFVYGKKDKNPKSFKAEKKKDVRTVSYIEKIKCLKVINEDLAEEILEANEDVLYTRLRKESDQSNGGTEENDSGRDREDVDYTRDRQYNTSKSGSSSDR